MKTIKINVYILIASAVLISLAACGKSAAAAAITPAATLQQNDSLRKLTVNGLERTYLVHIPSGINTGVSVPLVFVFHGFAENAYFIQQASGFNDIADIGHFIVVYPNGSGAADALSWNASGCCESAIAKKIDEAAFIRQIISDLGKLAKIDPKRTYAAGFSNGALLSYRLACEMSDSYPFYSQL